jgi:hypothetical protein
MTVHYPPVFRLSYEEIIIIIIIIHIPYFTAHQLVLKRVRVSLT